VEKCKWRKNKKKCSPSLAIKEMQIKITLRFYLTPVRINTIKNTASLEAREMGRRWRGQGTGRRNDPNNVCTYE
jgi:hypothetical protein